MRHGGSTGRHHASVEYESLRAPRGIAINLEVPRTRTHREFSNLGIPVHSLAVAVEAEVIDKPRSRTFVVSSAEIPPCRSLQRILRHTRMPEVGGDSQNSAHGRAVRSAVCNALSRRFVRRLADAVATYGVSPSLVHKCAS